jgi:hypothetical protein
MALPTREECRGRVSVASLDQHQFQLERASLVSAPVPGSGHLHELTERVAKNNGYSTETDEKAR